MDSRKFDDLTRMFAARASRRSVLKGLAGGAGSGLAAVAGTSSLSAAPACRESGHPCEGSNDCCSGLSCVEGAGPGQAARCVAPGQEPEEPKCRGEGHPCEGNQVCCEGLVCVEAAGPGNAARCVPAEEPEPRPEPKPEPKPEKPAPEVVTTLPATGHGGSNDSGTRWLGPLAVIGAGAAFVANRLRRSVTNE
jgi:hypothetical protein